MTAILLSILCFNLGYNALAVVSLVYGIIKILFYSAVFQRRE